MLAESHLLIEQSDLDVAERRHFLQTADRRDCSFAVEHLAADTVQVISGHLAGGDKSRVHKTCQKFEDVVDDLQHVVWYMKMMRMIFTLKTLKPCRSI